MILKIIDIYGTKLGFTLYSQSRFKSTLGGVFTIFTVIIYVIMFNYFAKDYYLKINPKVTFEKVYDIDTSLNNYTLTNDSFLFAIKSPLNYQDPNLYNLKLNYITMDNNILNFTKLDFISCNKTSYSKLFINIIEELYCIDMKTILNKNITDGNYVEKIAKFIELEIDYDNDYINTLNETYKQYVLNLEEGINYYLPDFSFSPNNYYNPLAIQLTIQEFSIDLNRLYTNTIKYVETKFEQDEHFLFEKKSEIQSKIHIQHQEEIIFSGDKKYNNLASFTLVLDGFYNYKYTRVYKKCPDILAQVSGIMRPLIIFFKILLKYFSKYNFDNFLINNLLCYFINENNKDDKLNRNFQKYKDFKNLFKNLLPDNKFKMESIPMIISSSKNRNRYIKEKKCDSKLFSINRKEEISENKYINNDLRINRSFLNVDRKKIFKKNFLK